MLIEEGEDNQRWRMISEVSHSKADDEESKMLCFTAAGQEAKRVHQLTDAEIQSEIIAKLKRAFPDEVPEPIAIIVPRWDNDPLYLGAYLFEPILEDPYDFEDLASPVEFSANSKIWFAGEAFSFKYGGFMTGAYLSGQETAQQLITQLQWVSQ